MNFTSICMLQALESLEKTLGEPTNEQAGYISQLKNYIAEEGRFYAVTDLTVELMRTRGIEVTEKDSGTIAKIAEQIEMDEDELWGAVRMWASTYGLKDLGDEDSQKSIVDKFLRCILPGEAVDEYMEHVFEDEECYNDPLNAILSNAYWWHSGGETRQYRIESMHVCDGTDDVRCVIYNGEDETGEIILPIERAVRIELAEMPNTK